jgi:hypothetical protein
MPYILFLLFLLLGAILVAIVGKMRGRPFWGDEDSPRNLKELVQLRKNSQSEILPPEKHGLKAKK